MPPKLKPQKIYGNGCILCNSPEEDEEVYGKMLRKCGITIHYFCMLFSSGLWQRGKKDSDGILGFLPADIRREQKRSVHMYCSFCHKKGGSIRCVGKTCQKSFHFRCGREAGSLCQFYDQFRAFCPSHRPHQIIPPDLPKCKDKLSQCSICMMSVEAKVTNDTLCAPCCGRSWFHRICIQRYAVTAGKYFFKCPLCNNKEQFEAEMLQFGIYIPEQDAAWEREPNAYQDLLERHGSCDASQCQCPQGRRHKGYAGSPWELLLCTLCGSSGTHMKCCSFVNVDNESLCVECAEIIKSIKKEKGIKKPAGKTSSPQVAASVEEIRQQLENQRTRLLRARRAAHRRATKTVSDNEQPSTSQKQESGEGTDVLPVSEDEEFTPTTSPSLLEDRRLIDSTPVVRIERANSEIEVNVVESSEEEENNKNETDSEDSEDSRPPGCARLITLSKVKPAKRSEKQKSKPGPWDLKGVIEKGQKKVVLLSMFNKQDSDSKDHAVQSTTSAMQRQLILPPSSVTCSAEETSSAVDGEKNSETFDIDQENQNTRKVQRRTSGKQHLVLNNEKDSFGKEDSEKSKSPLLITSAHKAALRRMILPSKPPSTAVHEVLAISDSSSEQEDGDDNVFSCLLKGPSEQSDKNVVQEGAEVQYLPQTAAVNCGETFVEIISVPKQTVSSRTCQRSVETNPGRPKNDSEMNVDSLLRVIPGGSTNTKDHTSSLDTMKTNLKPGILRKRRGRPRKNRPLQVKQGSTASIRQLPDAVQISENNGSLLRTSTQSVQTSEKSSSEIFKKRTTAQYTSMVQNPGTDSSFGQSQARRVVSSAGGDEAGQNAAPPGIPDDVLAMHRPIPPAFTQFQVPRPRIQASHSAVFSGSRPASSTVAARPVTAVYGHSPSGSGSPVRYPPRLAGAWPLNQTGISRPRVPSYASSIPSSCSSLAVLSNSRPSLPPVPPLLHVSSSSMSPAPAAVTMTASPRVSAPSTSQHYYFTVPTTQSVPFGVIAIQPQMAQNVGESVVTTQPCNMTMMVGQPAPASSSSATPQFIPIVPSGDMPFLQWFPLSQCLSSAAQQPGACPNVYAQGQSKNPAQQSVTVPTFQSPSSAWQRVPPPPSSAGSVQRPQTGNIASKRTAFLTVAASTNSSHEDYHNHPFYLAPSTGQTVSSTVTPCDQFVGQPIVGNTTDLPNLATSYQDNNVAEAGNISHSTTARAIAPVTNFPAQSFYSLPSDRPAQTRTRPELSSQASWQSSDPPPLLSLGNGGTSVFPSPVEVSDIVEDSHAGGTGLRTPVPVSVFVHTSPVISAISYSQPSTSVSKSVSSMLGTSSGISQALQSENRTPTLSRLLQATGLHCHVPGRRETSGTTDQISQHSDPTQNGPAPAPATTTTAQVIPPVEPPLNQVALVPPTAAAALSAKSSVPPTASLQPNSATRDSLGRETIPRTLIGWQPATCKTPATVTGNSQFVRQSMATSKPTVPARPAASPSPTVPITDQQIRSQPRGTVSPEAVPPADADSSLAISRGKIWLASEPMQSHLLKNDVVTLSDSDDSSDDLEIMGTSSGKEGFEASKLSCNSGMQQAHKDMHASKKNGSSGPEITGLLVPAPNKPPCPVHGHFRLVHHPRPTVPAKRNPDGSLSIDLTEDEPGPKRVCVQGETVASDDSDLEIIG